MLRTALALAVLLTATGCGSLWSRAGDYALEKADLAATKTAEAVGSAVGRAVGGAIERLSERVETRLAPALDRMTESVATRLESPPAEDDPLSEQAIYWLGGALIALFGGREALAQRRNARTDERNARSDERKARIEGEVDALKATIGKGAA